jgi:hypothetical protein
MFSMFEVLLIIMVNKNNYNILFPFGIQEELVNEGLDGSDEESSATGDDTNNIIEERNEQVFWD